MGGRGRERERDQDEDVEGKTTLQRDGSHHLFTVMVAVGDRAETCAFPCTFS